MKTKKKIKPGFKVGQAYFIQTVTHYYVGELVGVDEHELWLTKAAWVADTGRLTQAMATGEYSEVEIYPPDVEIAVGRGSIVSAAAYVGTLPKVQK